jgi:hypothetical protein
MRLLPNGCELAYADAMGEFQGQHRVLVGKFMTDYHQERIDAPVKLNG